MMRKYIERIVAVTIGMIAGMLIGRFVIPRPTVPPPLTDEAFEERTALMDRLSEMLQEAIKKWRENAAWNRLALGGGKMYEIEFKLDNDWWPTMLFFDDRKKAEARATELKRLDGFPHRVVKVNERGDKE